MKNTDLENETSFFEHGLFSGDMFIFVGKQLHLSNQPMLASPPKIMPFSQAWLSESHESTNPGLDFKYRFKGSNSTVDGRNPAPVGK